MPCNDQIASDNVLFRFIYCGVKLNIVGVLLMGMILFLFGRLASWLHGWLRRVNHDLWLAVSLVDRWADRCTDVPWDVLLCDHNWSWCCRHRLLWLLDRCFTCDIFWHNLSCICGRMLWYADRCWWLRIRIIAFALPVCNSGSVIRGITRSFIYLDHPISLLCLWDSTTEHLDVHLLTACRLLLMTDTARCHLRKLFGHWFRAWLLLHTTHLLLRRRYSFWSRLWPSNFRTLSLCQGFNNFLISNRCAICAIIWRYHQ